LREEIKKQDQETRSRNYVVSNNLSMGEQKAITDLWKHWIACSKVLFWRGESVVQTVFFLNNGSFVLEQFFHQSISICTCL